MGFDGIEMPRTTIAEMGDDENLNALLDQMRDYRIVLRDRTAFGAAMTGRAANDLRPLTTPFGHRSLVFLTY